MDPKILLDTPPWEWPLDAGKAFHEKLIDRQADPSGRLAAAELAGDFTVINDELADDLMAVAGNAGETEEMRARAAISFGPVLETADTQGFDDPDDVPITERTFHRIRSLLHKLYCDQSIPKEVRRRILEASVRATEDWHRDAIQAAYASGDREWMLTAVFAMRWVSGFDDQILEALESGDPEIHFEAVNAAGNWELGAAWPHILALVNDPATPKSLLLAAIGAVSTVRPQEAGEILADLAESDDEEIAEAARDAIGMAEGMLDEADEGEDEEEWIN